MPIDSKLLTLPLLVALAAIAMRNGAFVEQDVEIAELEEKLAPIETGWDIAANNDAEEHHGIIELSKRSKWQWNNVTLRCEEVFYFVFEDNEDEDTEIILV